MVTLRTRRIGVLLGVAGLGLGLVPILAPPAGAVGTGVFGPPTTVDSGPDPFDSSGVAVGDIDGDGNPDIVVANTFNQGHQNLVYRNPGDADFSGTPWDTFGGADSLDVELGDLNGDDRLDAFVVNFGGSHQVFLYDTTTHFDTATPFPTSEDAAWDAALGDLDGDGDLDVVVANLTGEPATVYVNNGAGNFTPHPTTPSFGRASEGNSLAVSLGDLDGDGDLDAVIANDGRPNTVWRNDGLGNFTPHPTTPTFASSMSNDVALGDIDGDGDLDAVVANWVNANAGRETVWVNDGSGALSPHPSAPTFGGADSADVELGDLDGDGDLDAVVANTLDVSTVWLNNGTGSFSAHPTAATLPGSGARTTDMSLADLDGDDDPDVVVANSNIREQVWLNTDVPTRVTPTVAVDGTDAVTLGQSITASATVSGTAGTPTGTVTFTLYRATDTTCSMPPLYTSAGRPMSGGSASSIPFTPTVVGTYRWRASYSGDANYDAATTPCNAANGSSVVNTATATATLQSTSGTLGQSVTSTVTVAGVSGVPAPTGMVSFKAYAPSDTTCTGDFIFASNLILFGGPPPTATSAPFTPTAPGSYRWQVSYVGDANYAPIANTACNASGSISTIGQGTPTLSTQATSTVVLGGSIADSATVTGTTGGPTPTGTVTFNLYGASDTSCSSPPIFSATTAVGGGGGASSGTFTPTTVGTFRWRATYDGDANYSSVSAPCNAPNETSTVTKATPTLATTATASVTFGGTISDTATVTGVNGAEAPTGTVTFRAYGPSNTTCTGDAVFTSANATLTDGTATSAGFIPGTAGTYRWVASYSGDTNYADVTGACNAPNETSVVNKAPQAITVTSTPPQFTDIGVTYEVTATGGASGNPVTFSLAPESTGCTIDGAVVTFTGAGTCVVNANQAGTVNYEAAPQVQHLITVAPRSPQAITFTSTPPAKPIAGTNTRYTVTAVGGGSGNPVTFSLDGASTGCTLSGNQVTFVAGGTCRINADQAGSDTHLPAPTAQQSFTVIAGRTTQPPNPPFPLFP